MTETDLGKRKAPAATGAGAETDAGAAVSYPHFTTPAGGCQAPMLAQALAYAARGWAVFPVKPDKTPWTAHGYKDATTDPDAIRALWQRSPSAGIGLACGASQLVAVDLDVKGGLDGIAEYENLGIVGDPLQSQTPSGGMHLVFADTTGGAIRNSQGQRTLAPGIDIRGNGGYIVLPPSRTPNGAYVALGDWTRDPGPLPEELRDLLLALAKRPAPGPETEQEAEPQPELEAEYRPDPQPAPRAPASGILIRRDDPGPFWLDKALVKAPVGNWQNDTGLWLACQLRDGGLSYDDTWFWMQEYVERVPQDPEKPYTLQEARASLDQAFKRPPRPPAKSQEPRLAVSVQMNAPQPPANPDTNPALASYHLTDLGNAERLVAQHGGDLRYCHKWGAWLAWDGLRWAPDESEAVIRRAKATTRALYAEASAVPSDAERKAVAGWAMRSEAQARIMAMIGLAQSEPAVTIRPDALDADPWLLTVANGTLDLRTGELRPPSRGDLITKASPARFDPSAQCPQWLAFLDRIMRGDAELIGFLQRAAGYSLTGNTSERALFLCHGTGANGKSTFLDVLKALLGDYATTTAAETIMIKRYNAIPSDVASLKGARLVVASETEQGQALAESLVKSLTGGTDEIAARMMYKDWFSFRPTFKLWLGTNHRPEITGTDNAIWDRIRLIPFLETIPPAEQDRGLAEKLRAELDGILAWAVRGCLDWQRDGLQPPAIVQSATAEYRAEMDALAAFLGDVCIVAKYATVAAGQLYKAYTTWAEGAGERPLTQKAFSARMKERGYKTGPRDSATRQLLYTGIGLAQVPASETASE